MRDATRGRKLVPVVQAVIGVGGFGGGIGLFAWLVAERDVPYVLGLVVGWLVMMVTAVTILMLESRVRASGGEGSRAGGEPGDPAGDGDGGGCGGCGGA
ncbi:hypothetical protein [Streptomyces sp. NPDC058486]|uniref:hypothetical protein n=1 Tax=unclassified Streptomyces TaxID=2593676 RepID=UPI003669C88B